MRPDDGTSEARSGSPGRKPIGDGLRARREALSSAHRVSGTFSAAPEQAGGAAASFMRRSAGVDSGHIHTGLMQVIGSGDHQIVSVRYRRSELDANPGTLPTVAVAEELLERLVLREAIALKVQAGEPQHRDNDLARHLIK